MCWGRLFKEDRNERMALSIGSIGTFLSGREEESRRRDALLRELVLCERMAAAPFSCSRYIQSRLMKKALLVGQAHRRDLEAIAGLPCPEMADALRKFRKQLTGKTVCPAKQFLLDPAFNLDEIRKNAILFDDHLSTQERYCPDCLNKHALLMEAFADEALGLDAGRLRWRADLLQVLPAIHSLRHLLESGADVNSLREAVRQVMQRLPATRR